MKRCIFSPVTPTFLFKLPSIITKSIICHFRNLLYAPNFGDIRVTSSHFWQIIPYHARIKSCNFWPVTPTFLFKLPSIIIKFTICHFRNLLYAPKFGDIRVTSSHFWQILPYHAKIKSCIFSPVTPTFLFKLPSIITKLIICHFRNLLYAPNFGDIRITSSHFW